MITVVMLEEFMSANVPDFDSVVCTGSGDAGPTGVKISPIHVPEIHNMRREHLTQTLFLFTLKKTLQGESSRKEGVSSQRSSWNLTFSHIFRTEEVTPQGGFHGSCVLCLIVKRQKEKRLLWEKSSAEKRLAEVALQGLFVKLLLFTFSFLFNCSQIN